MKVVIKNPVVDPKEIDRAVSDLVTVNRQDDFRDISGWMVKTGLGEEGAREELINKISQCILREMGISLVQVTLHELEGEKEIKVKYRGETAGYLSACRFHRKVRCTRSLDNDLLVQGELKCQTG